MLKSSEIHYIHFDTLDSTNTWVKAHVHTLNPDRLTCITALEQTAGHGRFNRKWLSPRGNIYGTLYFTIPLQAPYLQNLGQILGLSCADILQKKGFDVQIKWPNDLLIGGKKVAGVLCETVSLKEMIGVVLGIGINVNMSEELLDTIDQPATSLFLMSKKMWKPEQILELLLQQFLNDLTLVQKDGFSVFYDRFEKLLANKNQPITCHDGSLVVTGICHGITEEGKLQLLLPSGEIKILAAGEIC